MKERGTTIEQVPLRPAALAGLIALVDNGTISSSIAKDVFAKMYDTGRAADEIVAAEGLAQIGDEGALMAIVRDVARQATPTPWLSTGPGRRRRSASSSGRS